MMRLQRVNEAVLYHSLPPSSCVAATNVVHESTSRRQSSCESFGFVLGRTPHKCKKPHHAASSKWSARHDSRVSAIPGPQTSFLIDTQYNGSHRVWKVYREYFG